MNWPNAGEYQDAIQNPQHVFRDSDLAAGRPAVDAIGLPRVASGNFASVYEIRSGSKRWAIRCFLRRVSDRQTRYALLSQYLSNLSLPCLVDFEFQTQGILVRGQRYPIVKMGWVDGIALHSYVERHIQNAQTLHHLATEWLGLINSLHDAGLAHGDLQHGNVMVTPQGQIRLVDYDGMFVPMLQSELSHEIGHPNYQHPGRTPHHFDAKIDSFSALTIFLSIRALAADPGLLRFSSGKTSFFLPRTIAPHEIPLSFRLSDKVPILMSVP